MDVVDEQLDVAGLSPQPGDQRDQPAHGDENQELDSGGVVLRPDHPAEDVQRPHVGGPDRTAGDPYADDGESEPLSDTDGGFVEHDRESHSLKIS